MDVRKLKDDASKLFVKGKFAKAAEAYQQLVAAEPKDLQIRVRLGDALAKSGDKHHAVSAYQVAAEGYAREGFLPRAIAVCKLILEIDPKHSSTQQVLADLYARKIGGSPAPQPTPVPAKAPAAAPAAEAVAPAVNEIAAPAGGEEVEIELELDLPEPGSVAADRWKAREPQAPATGMVELDPAVEPEPARASPPGVIELAPPEGTAPDEPLEPASSKAVRPLPPAAREGELPPLPPLAEATPASARPAVTPRPPPRMVIPKPAEERPRSAAAPTAPPPKPMPPQAAVPRPAAVPAGDRFQFVELEDDRPLSIDARTPAPAAPVRPANPAPAMPPLPMDGTLELSLEDAGSAAAKPLPEIPLFSELPPDAFMALTTRCALRRLAAGEVVIAEGSRGESFFVLSSGKVRVFKTQADGTEVNLAELGEGAFFGEMALLSGTPRAASVAAVEESDALEISARVLADLEKQFPTFGLVLKRFCRQRLLSNVMATSAIFRPFAKGDRKRLIERFRIREVPNGTLVMREGQPSDGLYVVMTGQLAVTKKQEGRLVPLATLKEGDLFGEISLLTKSGATASVQARGRTTLLRLPREAFDELISSHPQVLALMSDLSDERLRAQEAVLAGSVQAGDEGLVLV